MNCVKKSVGRLQGYETSGCFYGSGELIDFDFDFECRRDKFFVDS